MAALKSLDASRLLHTSQPVTPLKPCASGSPLEMPNLENIIQEFEMSYLSPSKNEATVISASKHQQNSFVKKIVAAFEVKYKVYNDLKTTQETKDALEPSKSKSPLDPTKKSSIFAGSHFRSGSEEFKHLEDTREAQDVKQSSVLPSSKYNAENSKTYRRSGIFGSPFKLSSEDEGSRDESKHEIDSSTSFTPRKQEDSKSVNRRSGIFSFKLFSSEDEGNREESKDEHDSSASCTPRKQEDSKSASRRSGIFSPFGRSKDSSYKSSDVYLSPVLVDSRDSSSDSSSLFKFDKQESKRRSNLFSPARTTVSLDDTKTLDSVDLDLTLPEPDETIFLNHPLPKTSTMINEFDKEVRSVQRAPSVADKTPKVVGAFLKKPIEVEDTSIEWIPITGKKLPRKRSLKKLLTSWATKRTLDKNSKLFSSERNLNEEPRELQDSGYDERSCSSSSLTSLISITEALLQQENSYVEPERRPYLSTFQSRNSLDEDEEGPQDTNRGVGQKKKLLLTEVPREEVKLDLGPVFPSSLKLLTMSLDRKYTMCEKSPSSVKYTLPRVPKHPHLSGIPKHPFVALTRTEDTAEQCEEFVVIKNDLYEVEFRKSSVGISPSSFKHKSLSPASSSESVYDVPRRFLSKSEPEIQKVCRGDAARGKQEPMYDVPRLRRFDRPRSSLYDDALSLKRRSLHAEERPAAQFYALPAEEPHYATVKPRQHRLHRRDALLSSFQDISSMQDTFVF
nr:uncharacterized protein LOC116432096 [Nomia melanderi]